MPNLNQRRAELADRNSTALAMLAQNTLVPFGGDIQSETDAVILQQQGLRRKVDFEAVGDEITNETGRGLDMLAYYPLIDYICWMTLPDGIEMQHQENPLLYKALNTASLVPNDDVRGNKKLFVTAYQVPTEDDEVLLLYDDLDANDTDYYDAVGTSADADQLAKYLQKPGKTQARAKAIAEMKRQDNTPASPGTPGEGPAEGESGSGAFGRSRRYRRRAHSRFGAKSTPHEIDDKIKGLYNDSLEDRPALFSYVPMVFQEVKGASKVYETPDKMNKMKGSIKLDERVSAQLSIAAAVVVNQILASVPSHEITDPSKNYGSTRVIFFEDVVRYIQEHFGNNITLDPKSGDAFENMSSGEVNNFSRGLLKMFVDKGIKRFKGVPFSAKLYDVKGAELSEPSGGSNADIDAYVFKHATGYAEMFDIYKTRVKAMLGVKASNVGKVWDSKGDNDKDGDRLTYNHTRYVTNLAYMCTERIMAGNANMAYGTRFKMDDIDEDTAEIAVCSILTLVALHIITYSLAYSVDAYLRLAIRGADREGGVIVFTDVDNGNGANVITPQMVFPGVKAALEMYNVDARLWDSKVAFYLRTNPKLLELFLAAKKLYDIDTSKPAVKGFMNAEMVNPLWMESRASQAKYSNYYNQIKGRINEDNDEGTANFSSLRADTRYSDLGGDVQNITGMMETLRNSGAAASELDRLVNRPVVTGFGRRHRRRRSSSFGKKARKSRKRHSASFGKRRRRRSASFGKKARKSRKGRRSASFGKKKRHHSKKH